MVLPFCCYSSSDKIKHTRHTTSHEFRQILLLIDLSIHGPLPFSVNFKKLTPAATFSSKQSGGIHFHLCWTLIARNTAKTTLLFFFFVYFQKNIFENPHLSNYISMTVRSSHRRCSVRKTVLRNFAKFTGKHLCQSLWQRKRDSGTGVFL